MDAVLLLAIGAIVIAAAVRRSRQREARHAGLRNRVNRVRLGKMLSYLGADVDEYVRAVPVARIDRQIRRCRACRSQALCDACLQGKRIADLGFCPNYRSITAHSRLLAARRAAGRRGVRADRGRNIR